MTRELPPSNPEVEEALLGALLVDPGALQDIKPILPASDFYIVKNQWIYTAIVALWDKGAAVDSRLVAAEMKPGHLGEIGGEAYLWKLENKTPTSLHAKQYAEVIRDLAARRRLIQEMGEVVRLAHDDSKPLTDATRVAQRAVADVIHDPEMQLLTADAILTTDWPEPVWAVPGLLPVGLTILAGKPKLGKSWLALQITQAVAAGGHALGEQVEPGPALYLALEDSPRRLKDRMRKQGWPVGLPAEFMPLGEFEHQIGDLRNGGGEHLAAQIERAGYRLVVIDTLSRSCYGDQNDAEEMTKALTPLQEMAHAQNCAVMLVDHHRKGFGTDPDAVADILGSTAKGAMADSIWGLYRERGKAGAKLAVTGRDLEERNLALTIDWLTGSWQLEGDADELELTERRQEILDTLEVLGRAKVGDIAKEIGQPKSHTHTRLQDLVNAGLVLREKIDNNVYYELSEACNRCDNL